MRDLEIRGAGNLLGDEQSGHVAALGFELYMQMLDEAVRADGGRGRRGAEESRARAPRRQRRRLRARRLHPLRAGQDRRPPAHRRRARGGRARLLREELEDRFGPLPEPLANLIALQQARIKLGQAGARTVTFRGDRLAVTPIELDSARAKALRARDPGGAVRVRPLAALDARARRPGPALPRGGAGGRRAAVRDAEADDPELQAA